MINGELNRVLIDYIANMNHVDKDRLYQAFVDEANHRKGDVEITEDMTEDEYRLEEYKVLIKNSGNDVEDFHSINYPIENYNPVIHQYFKSISLVPKLRETRAFVGFSRLNAPDKRIAESKKELRLGNEEWLPAIEVYGEGIFFEFNEEKLTEWANKPNVRERIDILNRSYHNAKFGVDDPGNLRPEFILIHTLVKLLPNQTRTTSGNSKPEYLLLEIPEKIEITDAEVYEQYDFNLELAVEVSENEIEKLAFLAKQIGHMKESTLLEYLDCIDRNIEFANEKELFTLWLNLRKQIAQPNLKEGTVVYSQIDKIQSLIQSIEPKDIRVKYQKLYLENKYVPDEDFRTYWKTLEHKKAIAVKNIFDQFGAEETEKFGHEVKNMYDVAQKLGSSLNQGEISSVIDGYYAGQLSLQFYIPCVSAYVYNQGAEKLMETSLVQKDTKEILKTLSKIPFSLDLYNIVKQLLPNETAYWEIATVPYAYNEDESEELKIIVENFMKCKRYVDTVNIVGRSELGKLFTAQRLYDMLWLAGTEKSIGAEKVDDYAARKLIGWLQEQDDVALELKCDIEFIYLPILDEYSEVQPHALNTRLSNDPDYFCSLIELFYKKHSEDKHQIELNESMRERLWAMLLEYKVTPGVDWNGKFHENVFQSWMASVKAWSLENDRYEVTMQTVGSGLAYAELDDEKLPPEVIMEELNKAGNEELRRGYDIGIVNQRGVHTIDPEGKPEFKLAADYEMKAGLAEKKGYSRYAELLRGIAEQYRREASRNIRIARRELEE